MSNARPLVPTCWYPAGATLTTVGLVASHGDPTRQAVKLAAQVRTAIAAHADPARAEQQQAYMKSAMPYRGVSSPQLRAALRPVLATFTPGSRAEWEAGVRAIWDGAMHREERYAAIAFARHVRAKRWQDAAALPLHQHLVVTGAWWDFVDEIAAHLVGTALRADRAAARPVVQRWASDPDLWLRRTAILAQLRHREHTDLPLLRLAVERNLGDSSFWIRKAIGWALREYAKTDPAWVRAEVARLSGGSGPTLSPLSIREALKNLPAEFRDSGTAGTSRRSPSPARAAGRPPPGPARPAPP